MADTISPAERRALMRRVRRSKTPAEDRVCRICRQLELGYRRNVKSLAGSPDIANKSRRWAIFVNGCFWHHHKGCKKATVPKSNHEFWTSKLADNRRRDARKIRELRRAGYRVLLVWECETGDEERLRRKLSQLSEASLV